MDEKLKTMGPTRQTKMNEAASGMVLEIDVAFSCAELKGAESCLGFPSFFPVHTFVCPLDKNHAVVAAR